MPMAWDALHHLVPLQLGQGSSSHGEVPCGFAEAVPVRRSWAGELCVPPPSPWACRAHSCNNTPWKEAKEFS